MTLHCFSVNIVFRSIIIHAAGDKPRRDGFISLILHDYFPLKTFKGSLLFIKSANYFGEQRTSLIKVFKLDNTPLFAVIISCQTPLELEKNLNFIILKGIPAWYRTLKVFNGK